MACAGRSSATVAVLCLMLLTAVMQFLLQHSASVASPLLREETQSVETLDAVVNYRVSMSGCDFSVSARRPSQHITAPPSTADLSRVCCNTTAGPLGIEVYPRWAPLGVQRFLDMVSSGFFDSGVHFFRTLKGFIVQFGLSDDASLQRKWHAEKGNIPDDPPWLPMGPSHRRNSSTGVLRYQEGYVAYAGGGKNSRCTQMIIALAANLYLGGGSPWETPIGVVVGEDSYTTLRALYAEYGEHVQQGKIMNRGGEYLREEFPKLDSILGCSIVS